MAQRTSSSASADKPKRANKRTAAAKSAAKSKATKSPSSARPRAASEPTAEQTSDTNTDTTTETNTGADTAVGAAGRHLPELPDFGDVGNFIREQREKMEISVRRLSELAGVSNPYLSQIERGLRNPSADILQQVANALRISVESLYVRAGILPDQQHSISTVPEAIEHDRELSPEQKLALLNVYQSFLAQR